jgi:ABC-type uncharacterized transport system auxiliary subunit
MKKYPRAFLVTVALFSVLLTGCISKVRYPSYYTLNLPTAADPPAKNGVLPTIAVREFRAPGYLRQGPIVYRTSSEQIGFYEYHRWAVDPRQAVTNAVIERLRASGSFVAVKIYDGHADVDYLLSGRLEKLDEVDYQGGVRVEVELSAQVIDLHSGKTVWTNSASEMAKADKRNVPAIVAEMSSTTDRTIEKLLKPLSLAAAATATSKSCTLTLRIGTCSWRHADTRAESSVIDR